MDKYINVISFNVPYPPNYGGIIDVYYKLKALHDTGVRIILHCFVYERPSAPELEDICEKVYYYKRRTGLLYNFTTLPYNVYSRKCPELLANVLANDYPILFEGLHTCYYINNPGLKNRLKIYRESNIEHDYYRHLAKATRQPVRKAFLWVESHRFRWYEKVLRHADRMLVVSTTDTDHLRKTFPDKPVDFMPCFHANDKVTVEPGQSDFILYHGKLSVVENERAALYLIENVFGRLKQKCIIAGMDPSPLLSNAAARHNNIEIIANPSTEEMNALIRKAQIQLLITFQDTGLKLKLLNSLFAGRHTIVNSLMLTGSGLDELCVVANTPDEMIQACNELMNIPMSGDLISLRERLLFPTYSNRYQAERLNKMIYGQLEGRD